MRFERAILLNSPSPPGFVANKDSMGGFGQLYPAGAPAAPPLDLPYLAAYLRREGIPVEVLEAGALRLARAQCTARLAKMAAGGRPLVLVRTSLPTLDWDLDYCAELRRAAVTESLALIGPVLPSVLFRVEQTQDVDFALLGEPEAAVVELMRGAAPAEIRGLAYRGADGAWARTPARPLVRDLDELPWPAWDLFPRELYVLPKSAVEGRRRYLPMLTSRGCPYGCNYCPYPVGQGERWRARSPRDVVDEMEHLRRDFGIEYVIFRDPMFSLDQRRVREICREITSRGIELHWRCETRLDCLDEETLAAMAAAGCRGINFGIESSDPEIQRGVGRRPIEREEFRRKTRLCRQHGIETFAFFIVGLPGDDAASILDSIEFALEIDASWVQFTVSTPFIGTRLHAWAVDRGLVAAGFYRIVSSHQGSVGNETLTAAEIRRLHRFARLLQDTLINRSGLLKNAARRSPLYRAAKRAADALCAWLARGALRVARRWFERSPRAASPALPAA